MWLFNIQVPGQAAVYAVGSTYIQLIKFLSSGPDACGALSFDDMVIITKVDFDWGRVTGLSVAPALNSIFVGTAAQGTVQVLIESGQVLPISALGNTSTALMWIESWRVLYVSNDIALYTVT
jgi:hypothetical protein